MRQGTIALAAMVAAGTWVSAAELFVAPNGNDANPGTKDRPLATLNGAREAVRKVLGSGEDVTVLFRGGTYLLHTPVTFGPEDSASGKQVVTYAAFPGETPVFTGGRKITGWQKKGNAWTAAVPEAQDGKSVFRRLYVNDGRRTLARMPNEGEYFRIVGADPANPKGAFEFAAGDLRNWPGLTGANIVGLVNWESFAIPFAKLDPEQSLATLAGKANWEFAPGQRYYVENLPEALDAPGEWYLDRAAGVLSYLPRPGEDMTKLDAVAPVTMQFLTVAGQEARPVQGLRFRGLHFRHADYALGPNSWQGAESVPAVVTFTHAQNCAVEQGEIAAIGTYAVEVGPGCKGLRIEQNEIRDFGAGGVKVRAGSSGTTIHNNFMHDGGSVFYGGSPVLVQDSGDNVITHNEIADSNWMGICVGWSWGFKPTKAHNNRIEYNHLHHLGRGVTTDVGAIYTLGISTGTVIRNNLIHDVWDHAEGYLACGIYPDEGSTGLLIENNVVYRTAWGGLHVHYGRDNVVRNNIFAFGRSAQVQMGRGKSASDGANWVDVTNSSMTFERNIVLYDRGDLWKRDSELTADYNLYWNMAGPVVMQNGVDFAKWQAKGRDVHGLVADPRFVDPKNGDFRLKPDSPALALGFKPIDLKDVGLTGDSAWVNKPRQIQRPVAVIPEYREPNLIETLEEGFETTRLNAPPRQAKVNGAKGEGWIRVSDEAAAGGKRSLKFQDAPGMSANYDPHLQYNLDAKQGIGRLSFSIRMEQGAMMYHEWRDWSVNPYIAGPSLTIDAEGNLTANGKRLLAIPRDQWVQITIACPLGEQAKGTYELTVTVPGSTPQTFFDLSCDKRFNHLTWLGYCSMATEETVFYLDDLRFAASGVR